MKCINSTVVSVLILCLPSASLAITISNIVAGVSENSYSNRLGSLYTSYGDSRGFTHGDSPRTPLPQHDLARDLIVSNFQAMDYDTWFDPFYFDHNGYRYTNCNNVVAVKQGQGGTNIYIVGGHYDSVDHGDSWIPNLVNTCPGADDNASGVAGLLEAADIIQDYIFRDTIVFIAFDAEEKGFFGSGHFVNAHTTDSVALTNDTTFLRAAVKGMMSIDMIAYDDTNTPRRIMIGSCDGDINSPIDLAMEKAATNYTSLVPWRDSNWTGSDHYPFYLVGIDSLILIEGDFYDYWNNPPTYQNPHYHSDADSVDTPGYLSYGYAADAVKCIVGYLCEQAGVVPPATLIPSVVDSNTLVIRWSGAPNVSYTLYGTRALSSTNTWHPVQSFASTNLPVDFAVELDLDSTSQTVFRVLSE